MMPNTDAAMATAYAALRPQPVIVATIKDCRGKSRDILRYPVALPTKPPTNGKREVARRLRQIAAGQLKVST